jgi:two-component system, OmpR family, response regulator
MSRRILVVEDDASTADYVCKGLREAGFTVDHVTDGRDALYMATSSPFDAVILDRMIEGLNGLDTLKAMRAAQVAAPVILLTALSQTDERVKGLRAGADDYLTKPFAFSELHARLDNLLDRRAAKPAETELVCGDLRMDLLARTVDRAGQRLDLLPREWTLLEHLMRHKGKVVTRTMLLEHVWDYRFDPHTSLIDTHVSRLRKKIDDGFDRPLLHTVRGVGYRLAVDP